MFFCVLVEFSFVVIIVKIMNWIDRLIWRILAVVVVLLVNVLVDYRLKSIELERSMLESDRLRASLDDPISHVDYLITIYSPSTSKPCSYFCKLTTISFRKRISLAIFDFIEIKVKNFQV